MTPQSQTLDQLRSGQLAGARALKLSCGLTEFPREILDLAETLEVLDLSGNQLTDLPVELGQLRRLRILFCSDNPFTVLPPAVGRCPELSMVGFKANRIATVPAESLPAKLRWLILTDNAIETLPDELGRRPLLQKLMLAGNPIRSLPETMAACSRLELLRLAANRLPSLPAWLLTLPRLSWLAYSGNPFAHEWETQSLHALGAIREIAWASLELGELLGQGASGYIHRAVWCDGAHKVDVAVKLFKGAVTSDGLPASEMAAALAAGDHPNLTQVLGRVYGHPEGVQGVVMRLIEPGYQNLAGPPSFESCTRDVYAPEARFDEATVFRMAQGVASAAAHLHGHGIMHGDLYAHNLLKNSEGQILLGDFGAASFYGQAGSEVSRALQRLEVRAFGCMLEEWLDRCDVDPSHSPLVQTLRHLMHACLAEDVPSRPLFAEILAQLAGTAQG